GETDSRDGMAERRRGRGPEAERTVDVEPAAVIVYDRRDLLQRIERARVHVAGLGTDDRWAVEPAQDLAERIGPHPALLIRGDPMNPRSAETQQLERREDRDVL